MSYPTVKILPGEDRRLRHGSPWLFSNELRMDAEAKAHQTAAREALSARDQIRQTLEQTQTQIDQVTAEAKTAAVPTAADLLTNVYVSY